MTAQKYNFDNFYRPLIILSNLFCLPIPKEQAKGCIFIFYLLYALIVIGALLCSLQWSVRTMLTYYVTNTKLYLDILIICATVISNSVSILTGLLFKRGSLLKFVWKMRQIDELLKLNQGIKRKRYFRFLSGMLLLHIFTIACAMYESKIIIAAFGIGSYYGYVIFYFSLYLTVLTVLQVYHFSMAVESRFALLNKKFVHFNTNLPITIVSSSNISDDHKRLITYRRIHLLLTECVNLINDAFGVRILFITMLIVIFIVQACNTVINYGMAGDNVDDTDSYELILICVWNTSLFIIFAIMMASSCEQTIGEKNKSQRICHRLLVQLPVYLTKNQEILREELCNFSKQIEYADVRFSALGFFNVDHTLLLTIFGSIASYIIILIQLSALDILYKQKKNSKILT